MTAIPPPGGTFRVVARRGDVWWGIQVRELDWVFSQARRLDEVVETARDAIAAYYDVPIAEVGEVIVRRGDRCRGGGCLGIDPSGCRVTCDSG